MLKPLPFSTDLNIAVRKIADRLFPCGFDVGPDAPETLEDLTGHIETTGRMLVSEQHCENSIFGCAETNMAMRAWHDWCHWKGQYPFTLEGEIDAFEMQVEHLKTLKLWSKDLEDLLFVEVVLQAIHFEATGTFPEDQRAFTRTALAEMGLSTPRHATAYSDFLRTDGKKVA